MTGWLACGASVTGAKHRQQGRGCDDAFGYGVVDDFVVAVVADGAGSATGTSAWGAHIACHGVLDDAFHPNFINAYRVCSPAEADRLLRRLFDNALRRVMAKAEVLGMDPALLSTTLCMGIACDGMSVFGQIGDGVIAVEHDGAVETILVERKTEYANETAFLQSEQALETSLHTAAMTGMTAFALSTDGMTYKITDVATGEAYRPFFEGCWRNLRSGADTDEFGSMLGGIEDDQTGDDKTMVLAAAAAQRGLSPIRQCSPPPGAIAGRR